MITQFPPPSSSPQTQKKIKRANLAIVAPLSAHTLSKIANGYCNDALSCVLRAWDYGHNGRRSNDDDGRSSSISSTGKPLILAPAMNTSMYRHPITESQLGIVRGFWNTAGGGDGGGDHDEDNGGDDDGGSEIVEKPDLNSKSSGK